MLKNKVAILGAVLILSVLFTSQAAAQSKLKIVVLANSIDSAQASDFFGFLKNKGKEVIQINASNFESYKKEKFVVILGGPDAYEGVGEIVKQVINSSEQDFLRTKGSRKMLVRTGVWEKGQVVFIIAGSDRGQTKKAHEENRDGMHGRVEEEQTVKVEIRGFAYSPAKVTISRGTTVKWTNYDTSAHTATKYGAFDSGTLVKGDSWNYTFEQEGVFEYMCSFHPYIRGTVEVK